MEVWCVRYRWVGQEENAFASQAIESVMFARGKATLLQAAPGFPTTAWLRDHAWPVDPACGYGHGDMVAYRPNGCHVLGEGIRPRLREDRTPRFRRAGDIQPKRNPDGLLVALAAGRLVEPESLQLRNYERVYIDGSARRRRRNGGNISIVLQTNRKARLRWVGEFGRLRRGLLPKGLTPNHSRGAVLIRFPLQARPRD